MFLDILQTNVIQNAPQTGRLSHFIQRWMMITQDPWVLQTIPGHHIELMSPPVQHFLPGMPHLSPSQERVLNQEMEALLSKEAIHQVQSQAPLNEGFISSMFIVPKKDGGNRPVINLKPLNQFLVYENFKMEGIHMLRDLLKPDDYLVKIDLKDAYLTVPIWKHHQKYLRFLWKGTQDIHKINETSSGCFKTAGHSPSDILGRHTNHGGIAGLSITPCSINLGGPRFYSQLQKVPVSSLSKK